MYVVAGNPHSGCRRGGRISVDKYIKKKLRILEDLCLITSYDDHTEYQDRYNAAIKASDGDPSTAVDEEHYRILRKVF